MKGVTKKVYGRDIGIDDTLHTPTGFMGSLTWKTENTPQLTLWAVNVGRIPQNLILKKLLEVRPMKR